ncbi:glycosyltransferase [Desulfogranum japonicum]|uniref:glycosyltransferase n=1 Tax=Desulfogranum japonicum TaxID=231447 RepID=UPI0004012FBD|nr:glycosyltransferase [Desulfogranum japonicum]
MKVLHVLDTSVPDTAGYTTRGYYLVTHQKKRGCEPVVLTSERFKGPVSESLMEEREGIRYYRSNSAQRKVVRVPILAELDEIRVLRNRIRQVVEKEKIDIIHAHSPSLIGAAASRVCQEKDIPFVYEIRAFWEDAAVDRGAFTEGSLKYRLRKFHETRVVQKADAVIAICDGIKNDLLSRGVDEKKLHVVRNGVDHEQFKPLEVDQDLKKALGCENKVIIGFIGSFFNFEGLQDLIKAAKYLDEKGENFVVLLVGSGQVEASLRDLTKTMGLESKIIFTGRVPHTEVSRYYSIIDVLVYPRISKRITELVTPLKPLEAMAMEKVVVMSRVGGLEELALKKDIAVFFTPNNCHELAEACRKLCENINSRINIGKQARKYVEDGWSWGKRAEEDLKVYDQLLEQVTL